MLSDTKSPAALHKAGRGGRGINTADTLGGVQAKVRPSLPLSFLSSVGDVPRWGPIHWVKAKPANGITNRLGVPTVREVGYPAQAVALWAGAGKGGLFRPDLLHAIMDRLPVIGDWFCHLPAPP